MREHSGADSGSHPADQARSGLGAARVDPGRIALALERVGWVLVNVDYDSGYFITGDNLKVSDVQILHDIAKEAIRGK